MRSEIICKSWTPWLWVGVLSGALSCAHSGGGAGVQRPRALTTEGSQVGNPNALPGVQRSDVAAPRQIEHSWMSLKEWRDRHDKQLHAAHRLRAKWVVLGDSIVEAWVESESFRERFAVDEPLNLGIGGDQTQHLLWRLEQGIVAGLQPSLAVVLIGVNNLGNGSAVSQTVAGIRAVVEDLQARLPHTPLLLLRIFPAGETRDDELRQKILATNEELWGLAVEGQVFVEDIGEGLVGPDGQISPEDMADFLHPTPRAQRVLTEELASLIDKHRRPE